jgi:hypothetical protein
VRPRRPAASLGLLAAALLALLGVARGAAAAAEERTVEGVGAVAVKGASKPLAGTPRDAALRAAIAEAVRQVALELLPQLDPTASEPAVDAALGRDPRSFATRFRIVDDRGEGPAQLVDEPGVETEYVMVVHAQVDVARVRQSLERAGLLATSSGVGVPGRRVRIVIEALDGFAGYNAIRTLLDDLDVRGSVPVELERGRAVLEVESRLAPDDLLASLVRSAPPELRVEPVSSDAVSITLRARFVPPLGGPAP